MVGWGVTRGCMVGVSGPLDVACICPVSVTATQKCPTLRRISQTPVLYVPLNTPPQQAIIDDQGKTEAQKKAARDALKKQAEEARAIAGAIEKEKQEKAVLESRIKEMEGKVGSGAGAGEKAR